MGLQMNGWRIAEPWDVRVGQQVRVMVSGRTPTGRYRFVVARVTRLLKAGFGVEVRLPGGDLVTRDTQDVAVKASPRRTRRHR